MDLHGYHPRKIKFVSYDDSSNPAKTVEQARKFVEGDDVLLIFQSLGGSMNIAIEKYLNDRKVLQLFVAANNKRFGDPKNFPWTMGWQPQDG
jgi:branched-chain amino acid transport system substrate-binding protein